MSICIGRSNDQRAEFWMPHAASMVPCSMISARGADKRTKGRGVKPRQSRADVESLPNDSNHTIAMFLIVGVNPGKTVASD